MYFLNVILYPQLAIDALLSKTRHFALQKQNEAIIYIISFGCWSSVSIRLIIYKFLNVRPFDYTSFALSGKVGCP